MSYLMRARDNVTNGIFTWLDATRDFAGANYPGPNSPVAVSVAAVVADGGGGGGGGEDLQATLILGDDAGGESIANLDTVAADVFTATPGAELHIRRAAEEIVSTAGAASYLRAVSGFVGLRVGTNDVLQIGDDGSKNTTVASYTRTIWQLTVATPPSGPGRTIQVFAGDAAGVNQNGGLVQLRGSPPTGSGAAGGVDILTTGGAPLATFRNTGISTPVGFTSAGSVAGATLDTFGTATVGYLLALSAVQARTYIMIQGAGTGTPVAAAGDLRVRSGFVGAARNAANTQDLSFVTVDVGNNIQFGNSLSGSVDLRAATTARLVVAGSAKLSAGSTFVQMNVGSLAFQAGVGGSISGEAGGGDGVAIYYVGQNGNVGANGLGGEPMLAGGHPGGSAKKAGAKLGLQSNAGAVETLLHVTEVAAGRRVWALGGDVSATEMPGNTGDLIGWLKPAATIPTAAPASGCIIFYNGATNTLHKWRAGQGAAEAL